MCKGGIGDCISSRSQFLTEVEFEEIGSTQECALSNLRTLCTTYCGSSISAVSVSTRKQTEGVGTVDAVARTSRKWESLEGDICVSCVVLLKAASLKRFVGVLSSAVVGKLGIVISSEFHTDSIRFKPVNDLYFENRKFLGCLCSLGTADNVTLAWDDTLHRWKDIERLDNLVFQSEDGRALSDVYVPVVVGFGINVSSRGPDSPYSSLTDIKQESIDQEETAKIRKACIEGVIECAKILNEFDVNGSNDNFLKLFDWMAAHPHP